MREPPGQARRYAELKFLDTFSPCRDHAAALGAPTMKRLMLFGAALALAVVSALPASAMPFGSLTPAVTQTDSDAISSDIATADTIMVGTAVAVITMGGPAVAAIVAAREASSVCDFYNVLIEGGPGGRLQSRSPSDFVPRPIAPRVLCCPLRANQGSIKWLRSEMSAANVS